MYYIRCKNLSLLLNGQQLNGTEDEGTLRYDIPTEEDRAQQQQIGHWSAATADTNFVTERVVREGVFPTTAQMKKAAQEREEEALEKMAGMLVDGITISKPDKVKSKSEITEKDKNLDLPD